MTRPAKKPTNAVNDTMTALLREAVIRDLRHTSRNSNSFGYCTPDKKVFYLILMTTLPFARPVST